jgi:hypothetical protein
MAVVTEVWFAVMASLFVSRGAERYIYHFFWRFQIAEWQA